MGARKPETENGRNPASGRARFWLPRKSRSADPGRIPGASNSGARWSAARHGGVLGPMTVVELVEHAQAQGITLEAAGDRLRVTPAARLSPELRAALREHKAEVLALLTGPRPPGATVPGAPDRARRPAHGGDRRRLRRPGADRHPLQPDARRDGLPGPPPRRRGRAGGGGH